MTTPPYQPGQQPNQDPWGQQPGGGYGQYGAQGQPGQQPGPYAPGQGYNQAPQGARHSGQYGAAPQYGGTQQWPAGGYGGMEPPPPPPKNKTPMIVAIVVIAALVIGGASVAILLATKDDGGDNTATNQTSTTRTGETDTSVSEGEATTTEETTADPGQAIDAQVGDCIKVNVASSTDADVETVDCSTDEAIYKVAAREETDTGSCQTEAYVSYTEEGQLLLCLQLNVREGDCLQVTDSDDKRVACTSPDATYKVTGVHDVDDENLCVGDTTDVITYPQPPLTICLAAPQG